VSDSALSDDRNRELASELGVVDHEGDIRTGGNAVEVIEEPGLIPILLGVYVERDAGLWIPEGFEEVL